MRLLQQLIADFEFMVVENYYYVEGKEMLKKIIALVLSMVLVMSFCSCGKTTENKEDEKYNKADLYDENDYKGKGYKDDLEEVPDEVTTVHKHTPTEATCLVVSECEECGEVLADALGHDYVDGICSRCGDVDPDLIPVGLDKLFVIDSKNYSYLTSPITDSFGNSHTNVHNFEYIWDGSYAIFNLNKEYSSFKGSIVMPTTVTMNCEAAITIYVDDVIKYTKTGYTKIDDKVDFCVDVDEGKILKIEITSAGWSGDQCCIVNAQLTK